MKAGSCLVALAIAISLTSQSVAKNETVDTQSNYKIGGIYGVEPMDRNKHNTVIMDDSADTISKREKAQQKAREVLPMESTSSRDEGLRICRDRWTQEDCQNLDRLITKESGWNQFAINPNSGACGIFQAEPCGKLPCNLEDSTCQISWGYNYIEKRYQTPTEAWRHSQRVNWY